MRGPGAACQGCTLEPWGLVVSAVCAHRAECCSHVDVIAAGEAQTAQQLQPQVNAKFARAGQTALERDQHWRGGGHFIAYNSSTGC